MIIERNTFYLKFGKAKEAIAIWKQIMDEAKTAMNKPEMRLLTDITGHSYRIVMEMHIKSYTDIGPKNAAWMTHERFQELYEQFKPLCERAERELLKIEHII